ncbi:MAG: zinc-ribbon domain-containing protein, partial [Myxococcota bacterium]|nr:zinc-ribbon domain-containing protein [Myxococcota bacterium]
MKITCQSCNSKYNVADEKVQGKTVKIRCRKCGATIVVHGAAVAASASGNGAAPVPEAGTPSPQKDDSQWHVNVSENDQRTMTLADLVKAYETGVVDVDTFVWTDGMEDWKVLGEVQGLTGIPAANAAATGASRSGGATAPGPALPRHEAPTGAGDAYTSKTAEAGEAQPGPPGEASFSSPMGESAPAATPEPRRAAVVKREARARDLFATNVGEDMQAHALAAAAIVPPPPLEDGRLTGQRNENSVLFSLEVLTKSAEQRAPVQKSSTKDDSGIIDLKALAAKAESMRPAAALPPDTFAAPLAMASPAFAPFSPMGTSGVERSSKSKMPLLIGGAAGLALLLALLVVVGMRLNGPAQGPPGAIVSPSQPTAVEPSAGTTTPAPEITAATTAVTPAGSAAPASTPGAM